MSRPKVLCAKCNGAGVVDLHAPDGVLWGHLLEHPRSTCREIHDAVGHKVFSTLTNTQIGLQRLISHGLVRGYKERRNGKEVWRYSVIQGAHLEHPSTRVSGTQK